MFGFRSWQLLSEETMRATAWDRGVDCRKSSLTGLDVWAEAELVMSGDATRSGTAATGR